MKFIIYLLEVLLLCSITIQDDVAGEIKKNFFSKIKLSLDKRGSFNYSNNILTPKNTISKSLIIDRVELNNAKINEIGKRYNLEDRALQQIRAAFYQSQPNIYKDFEFSLNNANLNQILDNAVFTEYIGCCFRQDNMINYIILRLSINAQIYIKEFIESRWCIKEFRVGRGGWKKIKVEEVKQNCLQNLENYYCQKGRSVFDEKNCPDPKNQLIIIKRRPLNEAEKLEANKLVSAYSGEMFNIMIEEAEKKAIIVPEESLEVQSVFTTGQVFQNDTYYVQAEITDFGDVEIKETASNIHVMFDKECQSKNIYSYFYIISKCVYNPPCTERRSEYLISDQNGKSSCTKLKQLRNTKVNIKMEIYSDGSMAIKQGAGVLYYAKPNIKGKGPFSVGVTKKFELQIIDSQKVVVWKSTPVLVHDVKEK